MSNAGDDEFIRREVAEQAAALSCHEWRIPAGWPAETVGIGET
jgi:hypothetical protein